MVDGWWRRARRDEGGQSSVEHLGVLVVVVVLVGGLATAAPRLGAAIGDGVRAAVCSVAGGSCTVGPGELGESLAAGATGDRRGRTREPRRGEAAAAVPGVGPDGGGPDGGGPDGGLGPTGPDGGGPGPTGADSDGDGFSDADEAIAGSDPLAPDEELPVPPPSPPPPSDPGAGVFDSEGAGLDDHATEQKFGAIAAAAEAAGLTNASRHMRHYLGESGETLDVEPEALLRDMPEFREQAAIDLEGFLDDVREQAGDRYDGEPVTVPVRGEWEAFDANGVDDDWFYALGGFNYVYTGTVTVVPPAEPGGEPTMDVRYRMHVADRYNWDTGKAVSIGPFTVADTELQELHRAGLAREFDVRGSSDVVGVRVPLDDDGGHGGASPPTYPPGREQRSGERSDPGRERGGRR